MIRISLAAVEALPDAPKGAILLFGLIEGDEILLDPDDYLAIRKKYLANTESDRQSHRAACQSCGWLIADACAHPSFPCPRILRPQPWLTVLHCPINTW